MIRVLAFIEGLGVTGPARNLFATASAIDLRIATYRRVWAPAAYQRGLDRFVNAARERGIEVAEIRERCAWDVGVRSGMIREIRRFRPDLIQTHDIKSHALAALTRRAVPCPWLAFHHGYPDTEARMRVYNRLDRWVLPRADAVLTPCRAFADDLAARGVPGDRISVVHNAVTVAAARDREAARRQLGVAVPTLVSAGRLSREKGHDVLIDACGVLEPAERPAIVIAGDGPERQALERRARSAGVRLRLDGYREDLAPYYAAADIFALPSRSEGSPSVLLEAMAQGCAIIASRVGGVPELADDGTSAVLVPPDNPFAIAMAVRQLLGSGAGARMGAAAREAASALTPARRNQLIVETYARLLRDRCARLAWAR